MKTSLWVLSFGISIAVQAKAEAITAQQREFFEAKIRPVLVAECYECHAGKENKGGLLLDSRPNLLKGGDSGVSLVPGDVQGGLLIATLRHQHADTDMHMPKNGAKLEESIIADFEAWIRMGAPDPRDTAEAVTAGAGTWEQAYALRAKWWSLQPLQKVAVPKGGGHPVDAFVDEKLHQAGLQRAEKADARMRLRRLSFALTGLPPKVEDLQRLMADDSAGGWSKAVEHYLGSSAYGETWARHWMDLMRYAESHGSEGDPAIPFAWRYRDHLIRAFNEDVPYDQMVREHVAGDLLKKARWNDELHLNESLLATANLRLVEHGFQPIDSLDEQVKTVDNQIEVLTKSFLGLTVSCARCHDHKFDAISQKDYFALYGIFASTKPGQVTLDDPKVLNRHVDEMTALKGRIKDELAKQWLKQAEELPRVLGADRDELAEAQQQLEALQTEARMALKRTKGVETSEVAMAKPLAHWDFEVDGRDGTGMLPLELQGKAQVRDGRLILDGVDGFARTMPLLDDVKQKTLEAWVWLENVEQRGGGVISLETANGAVFDSIVFGEKVAGEWLSGSDNHSRTERLEGPLEKARELVHVAAVYDQNNRVTFYRNGVIYGQSYEAKQVLPVFKGGNARVLLGRRHTGGGRALLSGQIEEAALYDRALSGQEVAALFKQQVNKVSVAELVAVMSDSQRKEHELLEEEIRDLKAKGRGQGAGNLSEVVQKAGRDVSDVLHPWAVMKISHGTAWKVAWDKLVKRWETEEANRRQFNETHFTKLWDLSKKDEYVNWNRMGSGLVAEPSSPGEFVISTDGDRVTNGLLPGGVYSNHLSTKHNGLLVSPFFKMDAEAMSVKFTGGGGGGVRIVVDNYPLGNNDTYPQNRPDEGPMRWMRLDTSYRKGAKAYVEMATYGDLTRPRLNDEATKDKDAEAKFDGCSWFGISEVWLNKSAEQTPKEEVMPVSLLLRGEAPTSADELLTQMAKVTMESVLAWQRDELNEEQRAWLDQLLQHGLLSASMKSLPGELAALVSQYRELEREVPQATRAPGPLEGEGYDAPLMVRGNHLQLDEAVPRRFLEVLGGGTEFRKGSGRLELADAMTDGEKNPLLTRVMVNRVWHWLFGKGLVTTTDNFGRLGERPTHPELLDWLSEQFVKDGYSIKQLIRLMLTSETWQQGHDVSPLVMEKDAANQLWTRMPVRRLEAEMIRDAMLSVSGMLDDQMYGEPVPDTKYRRSLYLPERRSRAHPFLEVFDRPKPSTTRGQRDATNIPAQSLTMMNDVYVRNLAKRWAKQVLAQPDATAAVSNRVRGVYEEAFARVPDDEELKAALDYLGNAPDEAAWADYLQALFALKEFIYLR